MKKNKSINLNNSNIKLETVKKDYELLRKINSILIEFKKENKEQLNKKK